MMEGVWLVGRMRGGHLLNITINERSMTMERASVAVKCPTCEKIAESVVLGKVRVPNPLPREVVQQHLHCDLMRLYSALSDAARHLSPMMED